MLTKTEKTLTVLQERSSKGKEILRLYRELFKPELYRMAYANIYANQGAITKGSTEDTLDGMSEERIDKIIQLLKGEKYRWNPVRRTYIPKSNSKDRPLGIPSGNDKLLQAAMKILLEAIYEPTFSECSHGFRPALGCHTALIRIAQKHKHTSWFIEGDIKGCFEQH